MKILHITNSYFDTSVYINLQKGQELHGSSTAVISPCLYSKKLPENIPSNVLPLPSYSNWQRFFFILKERNILRKFFKHNFPVETYDVIHAHTVFSNGYVAWKLAKKYKKPFFLTVRNTDVNVFFKYRLNLRSLGIRIMDDAAGIIFLSESYRKAVMKKYVPEKYRKKFFAKSVVIPNSIYDSFFENYQLHPPLADDRACRILSVGEINANKNFPAVCEAVKILRDEGLEISLQIIGRPADPKEMKKIESYGFVNYHPPVPKEELVNFFRGNDIFVLASHIETFGLVYAEAMTQGMPVLYTAGQGFDEQFPAGTVGYSVNDMSPADIAEKIKLAMVNYQELSQNSSRLVEKFKCTNTGKMHLEFYCKQTAKNKIFSGNDKMLTKIANKTLKVAVVGLGYVGLPLAVEFGKKFDTIGFDVKKSRLDMLRRGEDTTLETSSEDLKAAKFLKYTDDPQDLSDRDIIIVSVPTPVDQYNRPDLTPLYKSSETVGKILQKGMIVVYESTVYPGCTEEDCVPVLEKFSGLKFNTDFFCGYSPERINPGDKLHSLQNTIKITSGSTPETADIVDALYNSILNNGTHKASCIKVAEAAKVIENSQRDLNIAFVNELAKIFNLIGIDTNDVLEAAGTKWNFMKFKPGLVGGHCIGVDPYYLTHKAQALGYLPEVILAGRRINDGMGKYVAGEIVKKMIAKGKKILNAKVLQLGITFKENCPDIRNSRAMDVVAGLQEFGCDVDILDPWADPEEVKDFYGITSVKNLSDLKSSGYDAVVLAVAHREFSTLKLNEFYPNAVIYDIKGVLPRNIVDGRL